MKIDLYARFASLSAMHVLWAYGQGQDVQKLSSILDSSGGGASLESVSITLSFGRLVLAGSANRLAGTGAAGAAVEDWSACATCSGFFASPTSPQQNILACWRAPARGAVAGRDEAMRNILGAAWAALAGPLRRIAAAQYAGVTV